jgi:hypothetical protein
MAKSKNPQLTFTMPNGRQILIRQQGEQLILKTDGSGIITVGDGNGVEDFLNSITIEVK